MTKLRRLHLRVAAITLTMAGAAGMTTAAHAATYDLAGLWLFNEGSGQLAKDSSRSGNPGQLGSAATADANDPRWVPLSKRSAALHFEGDDYVTVGNAPSLEPDGVTVVARLRAPSSPGAYRYVVSKGALSCYTASYGLYTDATGALRFYVSDGSNYTLSPPADPSLWNGAWHIVHGSYDGTEVSLWVDGTKVGAAPASFEIGYGLPQADGLYVGTYAGPCSAPMGFVGDIDGVALIGQYTGAGVDGAVG